ncbi:hypothetical protein C2845_PM07G38820 [Panicum miliaceum]|uniref:DJ-1/PfpI domain-containing protein n=1 Tax=Panicum miliaceum TaxID=4540 RepID=A0A3L6SRE3_PANMI|nr:hypothetical protein C2845_PM07G38820 [Panicum miliaceum]
MRRISMMTMFILCAVLFGTLAMQAHCRPQLLADANSTALYDERKNEDFLICVEYKCNCFTPNGLASTACFPLSIRSAVVQGGIPGAANLGGCAALESIVRRHALKGALYAAICAAPPLALARWGLLNGVKATAHPAFVDKFPAEVTAVDANVVVDGKVVTARGPAMAMEFALALVEQLYGKEKADQIAKPMLVRYEPGYTFKELNPIQWQCSGTPKVLIPLANANEEMEAITIIDALRRANADVVVASAEDGVEIVARHNTRIVTDVLLDAAADQQFDLIIVPASRN